MIFVIKIGLMVIGQQMKKLGVLTKKMLKEKFQSVKNLSEYLFPILNSLLSKGKLH